MNNTDFWNKLKIYQRAAEDWLESCFTEDLPQKRLLEAMRYSLLAGGKRIRPVLVLEFCHACGGDWKKALPFAAAIEMVHTYSLIHDDLPCMDDDDYRRGRLTNHKVYGEANAVLAGDALLTAAFDVISHAEADAEIRIACVGILADAAGEKGMVGGQVLDIESEKKIISEEELQTLHRLKTGALMRAACCMGVAAAKGSTEQMHAASDFAEALGLAFQIRDDMLDVIGEAEKLGKATKMDGNKNTFASRYGLDRCEQWIYEEDQKAVNALSTFEEPEFLLQLTKILANRDH